VADPLSGSFWPAELEHKAIVAFAPIKQHPGRLWVSIKAKSALALCGFRLCRAKRYFDCLFSVVLFGAVRFYVLLCGMLAMLGGMDMVGVRQVGVVGGFFVVARFMVIRCFMMVTCGMLVMLRRLPVMMGCFV